MALVDDERHVQRAGRALAASAFLLPLAADQSTARPAACRVTDFALCSPAPRRHRAAARLWTTRRGTGRVVSGLVAGAGGARANSRRLRAQSVSRAAARQAELHSYLRVELAHAA